MTLLSDEVMEEMDNMQVVFYAALDYALRVDSESSEIIARQILKHSGDINKQLLEFMKKDVVLFKEKNPDSDRLEFWDFFIRRMDREIIYRNKYNFVKGYWVANYDQTQEDKDLFNRALGRKKREEDV